MIINGNMYRDMVISAACSLENNKETVNNLNVFPVPDGDTGINMSLTMSGVRGDFKNFEGTLGETAQKAANLMLRGARGNSGVILSLFFRGIGKAWAKNEEADMADVVRGIKKGVSEAYKAVMNPTEGTILTVMRVMGETAEEALNNGVITDMNALFAFMLSAAKETLDKTPEMLPVLKQAGVVDSGGYGFVTALEGIVAAVEGNPITAVETAGSKSSSANFESFNTEDIKFAYCTECIVTKSKKYQGEETAGELHKYIGGMGDSVVFVDDSEIIKLHVHTNEPGKVITEALKYGSLYTVKIENMKEQHSNLSEGAGEAPAEEAAPAASGPVEITKKYGFVSVSAGDGFKALFEDLGADVVVTGGQTMNPSTEDILSAVEATPAEIVFVLPNNKNIVMVSEQAAKVAEGREVVVLKTVSVPEGVSAMLAFDPDAEKEDNIAAMTEMVGMVTTLSVTYAVRDTEIDGTEIHEGETLGLLNGKIKCCNYNRKTCIKELVNFVENEEAVAVTVYYGEDADEDQASDIVEIFQAKYPDAEVMAICGGQPVYSYVISIE
ncbi:MAG: DAK2 domain-containing protein [Clostridia bacterium]|nr:DAK2 domain-containing protein [Clostridia bacterium]